MGNMTHEAIFPSRRRKGINMNNISNIQTIQEFSNEGVVHGVYSLLFNGEQKTFVRNGDSIGAVTFYLGSHASQCVSEIRDDVKYEFLSQLFLAQTRKECAGCEYWSGTDCTLVTPDTGCPFSPPVPVRKEVSKADCPSATERSSIS
jgi:hypothetical protein